MCLLYGKIYIYVSVNMDNQLLSKALFRKCVCLVSSFVMTHTDKLFSVCVSSHRLTFVCVCCHTMLVWQIGERDSVSEANRYVSEANRYVGEAKKRPTGARIWGPQGPEILVCYIFHFVYRDTFYLGYHFINVNFAHMCLLF